METINENFETPCISTAWVEGLALEEINMDESGVVNFNDHLNPIHYLEESSIQFMDQIRERIEIYITKFNEYRGSEGHQQGVKIFKISNTINDFMLFRNSLRLIFTRRANDLITISFIAGGKEYTPRSSTFERREQHSSGVHEIKAHIGPFNNISWRYHNEVVDLDSMVRYYLSEFIRQSAK
jgi:hypothetical protein